jgi:hypothetical protein
MSRVRKSCGNCVAFKIHKDGPIGYCHANPPVTMQGFTASALSAGPVPVLQGVWPPTNKHEWCQQWTDFLDYDFDLREGN